jgi:hypothetical protein
VCEGVIEGDKGSFVGVDIGFVGVVVVESELVVIEAAAVEVVVEEVGVSEVGLRGVVDGVSV